MKITEIPFDKYSSLVDMLITTATTHPERIAMRIRKNGNWLAFTYKAVSYTHLTLPTKA